MAIKFVCSQVTEVFSLTEIPFGEFLSLAVTTFFTLLPPIFYYREKYSYLEISGGGNVYIISAAGFVLCVAVNFILGWLYDRLGIHTNTQTKLFTDGYGLILAVVVVGILPAVLEEILFRRYIMTVLYESVGKSAVFISAVVFGMVHSGFSGMTFAFVCGLILGEVFLRTGCLRAIIIVHMLYNIVVLFSV